MKRYFVVIEELPEGGILTRGLSTEDLLEAANAPSIRDKFGDPIYAEKPTTLGVRLKNRLKKLFGEK